MCAQVRCVVAHDTPGDLFFDGPRRREAAGCHSGAGPSTAKPHACQAKIKPAALPLPIRCLRERTLSGGVELRGVQGPQVRPGQRTPVRGHFRGLGCMYAGRGSSLG
jgi:hypothetical protein